MKLMPLQESHKKAGIVGILVLMTTLAVIFQAIGIEKRIVIDPSTDLSFTVLDDRTLGGKSVATLEISDNKFIVHCEIVQSSYEWPFCNLAFRLGEGVNGLDLSSYAYFKLWIKYETPQGSSIRFNARHFDPAYSSLDVDESLKYNTIEFYEKSSSYPLVVPFRQFQVPTWWLVWAELSHEDGAADFSNVLSLVVGTGYVVGPGDRTFIVERIEIAGELISAQNLYFVLLLIWGSVGLLYLLSILFSIKSQKDGQEKEFEALSKLLDEKTEELRHTLSRNPETGALDKESILDWFKSTERSEIPGQLSLMFISIDNFTALQKRHDGKVTDEVLITVSQVLAKSIRSSDIVARWGERDFVLICPYTELVYASQVAERLHVLIQEIEWPENLQTTVSFGVAERLDELPSSFIARATKALNTAIAQGGNTVVTATEHMMEFSRE
ncbi:GGDEF domain-containing protein [Exilibacterium tricleocarpae]|uniref:diguanylate cyclase n=1 Tax=Exilibacterium tricleocarpae TaxID=2591008 RepID=A0A545TQP1_9GAMM|nr:GGDEF domain-containing protein [Exilibacterium tricleocarpae]TQV79441.1 GGDEF domain-containing protein [Exilibacterium tricleocarpae]